MADTYIIQDHEQHERERERWLASRPVCDMCGELIQDEIYFEPEPGDCLCEKCFRQYVYDNIVREIE